MFPFRILKCGIFLDFFSTYCTKVNLKSVIARLYSLEAVLQLIRTRNKIKKTFISSPNCDNREIISEKNVPILVNNIIYFSISNAILNHTFSTPSLVPEVLVKLWLMSRLQGAHCQKSKGCKVQRISQQLFELALERNSYGPLPYNVSKVAPKLPPL